MKPQRPLLTGEVYKAKDGTRWRMRHRNGRIVAESGEAYKRPSGARRALAKLLLAIQMESISVINL